MAQVKLVMYDDNGVELSSHSYELAKNLDRLDVLESAVERLRPTLLSDLTHDLLHAAQTRDEKKELAVEDIKVFGLKP